MSFKHLLTIDMGHQTQEPGNLVTTTVRDYDLAEVSKLVRFFLLPHPCYYSSPILPLRPEALHNP